MGGNNQMLKQGVYEQLINEDIKKKLKSLNIDDYLLEKEPLDVEEAKTVLSSYISSVIKKALRFIRENNKKDDKEALLSQIEACNEIIKGLGKLSSENNLEGFKIAEEGEVLTALYSKINSIRSIKEEKTIRPVTPLSQSSLFTGSSLEPNMMSELKKEILCCDSIDMLVSFVKWSGLRCIIEELKEFTEIEGHKLRIITTSYMGATDYKAIEELSKLNNTEIKISYDTERTRLHAKAYLFKRETGFTTAYIGSSNLSNAALTSGLEWNIKVTEKDSFDIIKKFEATFESYWNDDEFILFNGEAEEDKKRLKTSLKLEGKVDTESDVVFSLDIHPYYYQKEILEKLKAERTLFGRNKNLLVAATGVGKTVIAAFDYKDFVKEHRKEKNRLLFIAHREEILKQSRDTFRAILKDNNFGDLYVGGNVPASLDHLFMSIQSFNSTALNEKTTKEFYDFIIVDEFHHAEAPSYQKLLDYYEPKILLGLTATPERMDGKNVLERFEDRIAAEMRLPEAIDRKLLSPFQYFAVSDEVDLSKLKWTRGGYDKAELERVYTNNDLRVNQVITSLYKYVTDMEEVIGLGFCVSVEHAKYMADRFNKNGIPAIAVLGESKDEERSSAKRKLVSGDVKFIFTVDLYNEGVDIPEINTVLFLRPTESLTIFLQQLGRGLRLSEGKECLTVLDFVGQAHKSYDFEQKFKALIGKSKHSVEYSINNGFLNLPKGCYIHLEKQAKEYILRNIKDARVTKTSIVSKLKYFESDTGHKPTLSNFLEHYNYSLIDVYGKSGDRSFTRMKVEAGLIDNFENKDEKDITKRLKNLFHINSRKLIEFAVKVLIAGSALVDGESDEEENRMLGMLYYSFYLGSPKSQGVRAFKDAIALLYKNNKELTEEAVEILKYNYMHIDFVDKSVDLGVTSPLDLHCTYSTDQIMAALGYFNEDKKPSFREGVKYFREEKIDTFFITLNKSEKDYSPSTLYEDYAINERLFHWQSQSRTSVESETGQRYINHLNTGNKIILFVRESKKNEGITTPYTYLGEAEYVSHSGSMPISFVWRLKEEMPAGMMRVANKSIV
jgi:superfamily II DNA or RNA helicase